MALAQLQHVIKVEDYKPWYPWPAAHFGLFVLGDRARSAAPALFEMLKKNTDENSVEAAIDDLVVVGPLPEELMRSLQQLARSPDEVLRRGASRGLSMLRVPTPEDTASYSIVWLGAVERAPELAALLHDEFQRGCAGKALALLDAKQYTSDIAALLEDFHRTDRCHALIALGILNATAYATNAAALLHKEPSWPYVPAYAATALLLMGDRTHSKEIEEVILAEWKERDIASDSPDLTAYFGGLIELHPLVAAARQRLVARAIHEWQQIHPVSIGPEQPGVAGDSEPGRSGTNLTSPPAQLDPANVHTRVIARATSGQPREVESYYSSGATIVKHGPTTHLLDDGKPWLQVTYAHGKMNGPLTEWDPFNGNIVRQGSFTNDLETGKWVWCQPGTGEKLAECMYQNGKLEGRKTLWREGKLAVEEEYENGEKISERTWHDNGKLSEEGTFSNGKKDGSWTYWDRDGHLLARGQWKDGKPWDGACRVALGGDARTAEGLGTFVEYHQGEPTPKTRRPAG